MLPIFSALIVSKPRGGKPVSFAILLRQNLGYALGLSLCYMVLGLIFLLAASACHLHHCSAAFGVRGGVRRSH